MSSHIGQQTPLNSCTYTAHVTQPYLLGIHTHTISPQRDKTLVQIVDAKPSTSLVIPESHVMNTTTAAAAQGLPRPWLIGEPTGSPVDLHSNYTFSSQPYLCRDVCKLQEKELFYAKLASVADNCPRQDIRIALGDSNAEVSRWRLTSTEPAEEALSRISTERTGLAMMASLEEEKPVTAHSAHSSAVPKGNFSALARRLAVRTIPADLPPQRRNSVTTRGGMDEVDYLVVEEQEGEDFSGVAPFMNAAAGIMVVSAAVGICANLYVVCAASMSLKSNVVNAYVLQRTLAQLLFLLFTPTLAAHIFLHGWTFGDVLCRMTVGFVHIAEYAEIFFLIAMSVDGHKAFDTYSTDTRQRDSKIAAATIWVLAIILGAPLFALFGTIQGPDGMAFCTLLYINWGTIVIFNHVNLLLMLVALVVPCALLPGMFPPRDGRRRELSDEALAARRLVLALVAAFWLFRLPYAVIHFCGSLTHYFNPSLIRALHLTAMLPYVNAAVDPVIYIVLRRSLASPRAAAHTRGVEITYVNLIPEL
ncbi:C-C chemokine receptor 1-like protein 1 [Penaeus chinensis]|uniref:C-C chemokine receptor 1-like protein 1 n=1 Tax=Penaeus chinensis TaxID=139456 RepID=UPI001FB708E7|nr:C-C chemokine receptor 1-like protein 1 [Penaeus chinensis]